MRFGKKMALWAFCTVPAAAALLVTGTGVASAAPLPHTGPPSHGPHCNPWQRESWDVNGANTVKLTYNSSTYTYAVTFRQNGSCVGGTLTDTGLPAGQQNRSVSGYINNNHITFSVSYPTGYQGTRTFTGDINRWGSVSGTWSETGTEKGSGPWSLARQVHPACRGHHGWIFNPRGCQVFGH